MKREEVIGIKLECIGTDYKKQFTVGKVYEIEEFKCKHLKLVGDDGWMWNVYDYESVEHLVSSLSQTTHGKFKLYKKENPNMGKKMTKAELEGKFVRCIQGGDGGRMHHKTEYKEGDFYKIEDGHIDIFGGWMFTDWYDSLPKEFTISELNNSLQTKCGNVKFEYVGNIPQSPNKVKSDEVKPDKKPKVAEIKVKVDMLFDTPIIEETDDEVFIFSGRSTIYINKEFGIYGVATVNSKELSSYNKEIGMSLAYKRSFDKLK